MDGFEPEFQASLESFASDSRNPTSPATTFAKLVADGGFRSCFTLKFGGIYRFVRWPCVRLLILSESPVLPHSPRLYRTSLTGRGSIDHYWNDPISNMSFGFSIGDFIAVGELAWKVSSLSLFTPHPCKLSWHGARRSSTCVV